MQPIDLSELAVLCLYGLHVPSKFGAYSFVSSVLGAKNDSLYTDEYVKKCEFEMMVFLDSGGSETKNVTTPAPIC